MGAGNRSYPRDVLAGDERRSGGDCEWPACPGSGEPLARLALPATGLLDEQPAVLELLLPQPPTARRAATSRVDAGNCAPA
jgi:hypothetical protein